MKPEILGEYPHRLTGEIISKPGGTEWDWFKDNILKKQAVIGTYASFSRHEIQDNLLTEPTREVRVFMVNSEANTTMGINRFQLGYILPGEILARLVGFTWVPDTGKLCVFPDETSIIKTPQYDVYLTPERAMLDIIALHFTGARKTTPFNVIYVLRSQYGLKVKTIDSRPSCWFTHCVFTINVIAFTFPESKDFSEFTVEPFHEVSWRKTLGCWIPKEAKNRKDFFNFFIYPLGMWFRFDNGKFKLTDLNIRIRTLQRLIDVCITGDHTCFSSQLLNAISGSNKVLKGKSVLNFGYDSFFESPNIHETIYGSCGAVTETLDSDQCSVKIFCEYGAHTIFPEKIALTGERDPIIWSFFQDPCFSDEIKVQVANELCGDKRERIRLLLKLRCADKVARGNIGEKDVLAILNEDQADEEMSEGVSEGTLEEATEETAGDITDDNSGGVIVNNPPGISSANMNIPLLTRAEV